MSASIRHIDAYTLHLARYGYSPKHRDALHNQSTGQPGLAIAFNEGALFLISASRYVLGLPVTYEICHLSRASDRNIITTVDGCSRNSRLHLSEERDQMFPMPRIGTASRGHRRRSGQDDDSNQLLEVVTGIVVLSS